MAEKLSDGKKRKISVLIDKGESSHKIAKKLDVTLQQVAAIRAWKTMGAIYT